ncbi:hypothetical protein FC19_GL000587 [Liquorilactobacillus aquaticus DSM 21051]|uniref:Uncharacterized protein n=1 Tax=Liquorilactobacillus aquaticus DSM 21051 TaxID=1423725 RepID=A0A0R2CWN7_9LACO|nr:hypothetical protein [Liquorilactobacillus aquaticus]KRM96303.1 hypothetical protein FC19_GL000587 [Liquorilactobacillus aquaticus DSM 21051]
MKKIIFEQVGNIGMVFLLAVALAQTVSSSTTGNILFGSCWFFFLVWTILFGLLKWLYSKFGKKEGYDFMDGEFSSRDEREKVVSNRAVTFAYKATITLLLVECLVFAGLDIDSSYLKIIGIFFLSGSIIFGFLAYMLSWIFYNLKI